ncbi:PIR protein [Plasmodium ovale]|uniref:PIR Superfamily Protein n=2 Tax=Plasmodium ovale TaxID=36330 RepID=A0A1A8X8Q4_PLAOA|nr:PIR Superfamily Protein [Plasmodium ovale curtisi]SBT83429.1 PIR protein [Plasmodium ovale]
MIDDNMSCIYEDEKENYEFLDYADIFIPYAEQVQNDLVENAHLKFCNLSSKDNLENIDQLTNVCKKFDNIIKLLFNDTSDSASKYTSYSEFMNYWLNNQFKLINKNSTCVLYFFQTIMSKDNTNTKLREIKKKIRDIKYNELENLNILYNLYEKYHKIKNTLESSHPDEQIYIKNATSCVEEFKKGEAKCSTGEKKFCSALSKFRDKYEKINLCSYDLKGWGKKTLPQLTSDSKVSVADCEMSEKLENGYDTHGSSKSSMETPSDPDTNVHSSLISASSVAGICLVSFIIYKFTSFGSWLSLKITGKNKIQHNLDDENDQLLHRTEYEYMNIQNTAYNVAYNSL